MGYVYIVTSHSHLDDYKCRNGDEWTTTRNEGVYKTEEQALRKEKLLEKEYVEDEISEMADEYDEYVKSVTSKFGDLTSYINIDPANEDSAFDIKKGCPDDIIHKMFLICIDKEYVSPAYEICIEKVEISK